MDYDAWCDQVPVAITEDNLWRMEVYRLSLFLTHVAWSDSGLLSKRVPFRSLSDQLIRAVGSIGANIAEGYSRHSHRDQIRFYEYALGSAREARHWYFQTRPILGDATVIARLELLSRIIRNLLGVIARHRNKSRLKEHAGPYVVYNMP